MNDVIFHMIHIGRYMCMHMWNIHGLQYVWRRIFSHWFRNSSRASTGPEMTLDTFKMPWNHSHGRISWLRLELGFSFFATTRCWASGWEIGKHFALLQLQCCHLLQPANWNHLTSLYLHLLTAWYWRYILIHAIYFLTYTTQNHWGRQKKTPRSTGWSLSVIHPFRRACKRYSILTWPVPWSNWLLSVDRCSPRTKRQNWKTKTKGARSRLVLGRKNLYFWNSLEYFQIESVIRQIWDVRFKLFVCC